MFLLTLFVFVSKPVQYNIIFGNRPTLVSGLTFLNQTKMWSDRFVTLCEYDVQNITDSKDSEKKSKVVMPRSRIQKENFINVCLFCRLEVE